MTFPPLWHGAVRVQRRTAPLYLIFRYEVVIVADKLTPKQRRFTQEYTIDHNATQAAIRAGYSPKTAGVIGAENLTKPNIAAEIKRIEGETVKKLDITRERIAQELAEIAFAKATDYVSVETEPAPRLIVHPLTGEPMTIPGGFCQTVRITDTAGLAEDKKAAIASIKQGANGIELKTHDKVRALEMLGKMLGMFDSREAPAEQENNLFDAIVGSMEEVLDTDDLPEVEQAAAAGDDVVEPSSVSEP